MAVLFILRRHNGGMVISGVAEQVASKIASIVYLDAFVPADGQSIGDLGGKVDAGPFTAPIPAARFAVNEADQAWVDSKMTPQSTACFTEKIKLTGAYQRVARMAYIRAKNFAGFAATLEKIRNDPSWKTWVVDCAQVPQNVRSTRSPGAGGCSNSPQPG